MHKLFTEGTRGEPLKQTEIGPVPESWRVEKLGVLVNFSTGKLNANAAVPGGQYPFFTCSQETFAIDKYAFDTEAVLLSGNNARAVYSVKRFCGRFNAYQRTYVITIKDASRLEYSFLQWALEFNLERLRVLSIGSSTKYLTLGLLENLLVPIPELDEARNIGDALDSVSQRQARAERCAGTLRNLFRTLLHQLMTAQIRVHDLDLSALDEPARQPTRIT
jgi:type I restriction enzyme S subunit